MILLVTAPRIRLPEVSEPTFVLSQDKWDDWGFRTQYHLHYKDKHNKETYIGDVKIIQIGHKTSTKQLLGKFTEPLGSDYCSLGQSLDYYERLSQLGTSLRDEVLACLNDITKFPGTENLFENEEALHKSLFRSISDRKDYISLARSLLLQDYTELPATDLEFSFHVAGWINKIDFCFTNHIIESQWGRRTANTLPSRISVIIGRNGCGKSTLLARLARVMHASKKDREGKLADQLGTIHPIGIGFPRIITISYSAFDSFQMPGITNPEKEQIAKDVITGNGRFIFCGLRDIAQELQEEMKQTKRKSKTNITHDRVQITLLKSIVTIASEFSKTLDLILEKQRVDVFDSALKILSEDPSFNNMGKLSFQSIRDSDPIEFFISLSTGLKISIQIISEIIAHTEPRSIILIDEPETHIHPPLLAALMLAIRMILDEHKSFAIIATHSPIIVQETLSSHVNIIRNEGDETNIQSPRFETFGENLSTIISESFGLSTNNTDYHESFRTLARRHSLNEIKQIFEDKGLSMQGLAYIMSIKSQQEEA